MQVTVWPMLYFGEKHVEDFGDLVFFNEFMSREYVLAKVMEIAQMEGHQ